MNETWTIRRRRRHTHFIRTFHWRAGEQSNYSGCTEKSLTFSIVVDLNFCFSATPTAHIYLGEDIHTQARFLCRHLISSANRHLNWVSSVLFITLSSKLHGATPGNGTDRGSELSAIRIYFSVDLKCWKYKCCMSTGNKDSWLALLQNVARTYTFVGMLVSSSNKGIIWAIISI